jgi:Ni/Co efflux regulator RcnB
MKKLVVPALLATIVTAVLAGGATGPALQRGEQQAKAQQASALAKKGRYRSVEASGQLRRGAQLPPRYRAHQYVLDDWKLLQLSEPPRGHQWVRAGRDYALVSIATGVVTEVLVAQ